MKNAALLCIPWLLFALFPDSHAHGQSYVKAEIYDELSDLGHRIGLHGSEIDALTARLNEASFDPAFVKLFNEKPVRAIFVFSAAEGGVIFKFMSGKGLTAFADGRPKAPIWVDCRSVGALIGGSHRLGVGLVMSASPNSEIGGTYEGSVSGATFATESTPTGAAFWKMGGFSGDERPVVYLVYTARGLSFGAGNERLTLTTGW